MLLCDDPRISREGLLLSITIPCNHHSPIRQSVEQTIGFRNRTAFLGFEHRTTCLEGRWLHVSSRFRMVEIFSRDTFGSFTRAVQRTASVKRSIDTIQLLQVHFFLKNFVRRKTLKTLSLIQFVFSKSKGSILPEEYYFHTFFYFAFRTKKQYS